MEMETHVYISIVIAFSIFAIMGLSYFTQVFQLPETSSPNPFVPVFKFFTPSKSLQYQSLQSTPFILSPTKSPSVFEDSEALIPKIIHQTWECENVPERYHQPMESWKSLNPEYTYKLWTKPMRRSFIRESLGDEKLQLYDQLLPGAYRADLFRSVVLFFQGGFYSDVDATLYVPLRNFNKNVSFIAARDLTDQFMLHNGAIFGSEPGHPIVECVIGEIFEHIQDQYYPDSTLEVSGPGVLGECYNHVYGIDHMREPKPVGFQNHLASRSLIFASIPRKRRHRIMHQNKQIVVLGGGGSKYDEADDPKCKPSELYSLMFEERRVYAKRKDIEEDSEKRVD